MSRLRPLHLPPIPEGPLDAGHVLLRDGTVATLRLARPDDHAAMHAFLRGLSAETRQQQFASESPPADETIRSLCDASDPRRRLTLIALHDDRIIGAGSYVARDQDTAEVALGVDDPLRRHGLGTALLERLALLAIRHGFTRFRTVTHADNLAMRSVFAESGFSVREVVQGGEVEVELSLALTEAAVQRSEWRDRLATTASLRPLFQPERVAIVGASRDPQSIGYRLLDAVRTGRFQGRLYAVNPRAAAVGGFPTYPSLRALVVISTGFAEVGEAGQVLQNRIVAAARRHGMRLVGPNCFGVLNTDPAVRLNATFSPLLPSPGRIAMASQSGALGLALLAAAERLHLGVSTFASVGNKADVSVNDLLQYWESDPATGVILLYVESFGNPRRFAQIARRVGRQKPIVALKAGRTASGRRAAGSHTAALAADNVAVEALFRQTGVIRADTLEELSAMALGLSEQPLPRGRRVGILTNAGGPAVLCADACEAGGLAVPELSASTTAQLASFLSPSASVRNPVDLLAQASPLHYERAVDTLLTSDNLDALIVLYVALTATDTGPIAEGIRNGIAGARKKQAAGKPVYIVWMAEADRERRFVLPDETIPTYALPELPARVLSRAADYAEWRDGPPGMIYDFDDFDLATAAAICREALSRRGSGWLTVAETRSVLRAVALPLPPGGLADTPEEAAAIATRIGFPVAVKLASHRIVHKTEIGGVHLNLPNEAAVRDAYEAIQARLARDGVPDAMEGVLVQPMLTGGVEVMAGMTYDPSFGPLIGFGLGGIHVEILGDIQFRVTPLTDLDAASMIEGIRGIRLLRGYRGHPPADLGALKEVLLQLSRLVEEIPEIVELDLNPIFAFPPGRGCLITDARIRVAPAAAGSPS